LSKPQLKIDPERRARLIALHRELNLRMLRKEQAQEGGLLNFVRYFWDVLEPQTEFVEGEALDAICQHLEAVTFGDINRLLINVPPGFMKSLLTDVFWPAWEWGPMEMPHLRYVAFSYAAGLTERDNGKFRDLITSHKYQELWGDKFKTRKIGEVKITNDKTGSKLATSVGGIGTGERGDRIILDDPHNVKEGESEAVRGETVRWFRESLSNRLNSMEQSAIVVIMQRVHEADVSGTIIENGFADYVHLMIPMEYDAGRHCTTPIWTDWREEDGELAWPERFPTKVVDDLKTSLGPYAYAGQYQQAPAPRGGGIFKRDWWQLWESPDDSFPPMEFVLVSADTAYTEKEANDPTGCTVWGLWRDKTGAPRIMLMHAWRKHLEMHGKYEPRFTNETNAEFARRTQGQWGLVEWLAHTCQRYKADRLIIEGKASGLTAAQEIRRLHGTEGWGVQIVQPHGDKVSRAHAVQPVFSQLLVYAPDKEWAETVMSEMESFPKGRYKDLTDSATQAMKFLRDSGMIVHRHEHEYEVTEINRFRGGRTAALYPV
jgi:predicted phage terminase large subunit-like protein